MNDDKKDVKKNEKEEAYKVPFLKRVIRPYYAEFRKIVWPTKETLIKHTITVAVVSLIFGAYIALVDGVLTVLFGRFVQLVS